MQRLQDEKLSSLSCSLEDEWKEEISHISQNTFHFTNKSNCCYKRNVLLKRCATELFSFFWLDWGQSGICSTVLLSCRADKEKQTLQSTWWWKKNTWISTIIFVHMYCKCQILLLLSVQLKESLNNLLTFSQKTWKCAARVYRHHLLSIAPVG